MQRLSPCLAMMTAFALAACERAEKTAGEEPQAASAAEPTVDEAESADPPLVWAKESPTLQWGACPPGMPEGCQIAVLHGDPAKPNADILLRVPGGAALTPHWHSSAERMMLVSGRLAVKYRGAAEATLEPGTYAYGPARLPHRADCRSSEPCTLFIAFEGPVDRQPFEGEL